jgi:hypothetical protein
MSLVCAVAAPDTVRNADANSKPIPDLFIFSFLAGRPDEFLAADKWLPGGDYTSANCRNAERAGGAGALRRQRKSPAFAGLH